MNVITMNIGQGALVLVRHKNEAIIVDSCIPSVGDTNSEYVIGFLSKHLKDRAVRGFILTGFDNDHADAVGVAIVLKKYRPEWIMYPTYYKDTEEAKQVFKIIREQEMLRENTSSPLRTVSVRLDKLDSRFLTGLSSNFSFELFSPHIEDADNSNNCSIVLKLSGKGTDGFSYLITGDTEYERWEKINTLFGNSLQSDVMSAPHHGSKNSTHPKAVASIRPNTVLISAGVDNQYGHPDSQAVAVYSHIAKHIHCTNGDGGISLLTRAIPGDFKTVGI